MKNRTHLAESAEPLREGDTITSVCGVEIPNACFVTMGDGQLEPNIYDFISTVSGLCSHCAEPILSERYVAAIRAGKTEPYSIEPNDISPNERNIV